MRSIFSPSVRYRIACKNEIRVSVPNGESGGKVCVREEGDMHDESG